MASDDENAEKNNTEGRKSVKKRSKVRKSSKRCQYSKLNLDEAVEDVRSGKSTLNHAAVQYGIPKTTLHSRVNETVPAHPPGRHSILAVHEEKGSVRISYASRGGEGCCSESFAGTTS